MDVVGQTLRAAGCSAAPSSPSALQVIPLNLLPLSADFARCLYSSHSFCAVIGNGDVCVCVCVLAFSQTLL